MLANNKRIESAKEHSNIKYAGTGMDKLYKSEIWNTAPYFPTDTDSAGSHKSSTATRC